MSIPEDSLQAETLITLAHAVGASKALKWCRGNDRSLVSLLELRGTAAEDFASNIEGKPDFWPIFQGWGAGFDERVIEELALEHDGECSSALNQPVLSKEQDGPQIDVTLVDACRGIQTCLKLIDEASDSRKSGAFTASLPYEDAEALRRFARAAATLMEPHMVR